MDSDMYVLRWTPNENRWVNVKWDDFVAFRAMFVPFRPLAGLSAGVHYFVVCICAEGETVNLLPHKYLVEPSGQVARDNFNGWTREERTDFDRLIVAKEFKAGEEERLRRIQAKNGYAMYPPRDSLYPLANALPYPPAKDSPAVRFLDEVGAGGSKRSTELAR